MKISIILPSIFPEACQRTKLNIAETTRSRHEVIVVSPFDPGQFAATWVREDQPRGSAGATAAGLAHCTGEYVLAMADDRTLLPGWDEAALADYQAQERARPLCLGLRDADRPHVGTVFGHYYPYFPFTRRPLANCRRWYGLGDYFSGFGDCDLGLDFWISGGECRWSTEPLIRFHADDLRERNAGGKQSDRDGFVKRWAPIVGKGWSTKQLHDFNIDVDPVRFPRFAGRNTIQTSDPIFADMAQMVAPPYMIHEGQGFNLVAFRGQVIVMPQGLGGLNLEDDCERAIAFQNGARAFFSKADALRAVRGA